MLRSISIGLLLAGMAVAACGPVMGRNYAVDCRIGVGWDLPGLVEDGSGRQEPRVAEVVRAELPARLPAFAAWARWLRIPLEQPAAR